MKISENFSIVEFEVSENYPDLVEKVPANLRSNVVALVENVLQPLRTATGWKCEITSGYRGEKLNKAVGGIKSSQHRKAEAADTKWFDENEKQVSTYRVMKKAKEIGLTFDQMIGYPTFIHFSHSKNNRKQVLYNKSYKGKKI